jgi:hypothetical protein
LVGASQFPALSHEFLSGAQPVFDVVSILPGA